MSTDTSVTTPITHLERSMNEMLGMLKEISERLRELETREAGTGATMNAKIDALWRKTDEHETRLKMLEMDLVSAKIEIRQISTRWALMAWIGAVAGGAVILWIVNGLLKTL